MLRRICFSLLTALIAVTFVSGQSDVVEEFSQSYSIDAGGRLSLKSVCGDVHVQAWDRAEVLVEAIKTGPSREALRDAQIRIDSSETSIAIETEYPSNFRNFSCNSSDSGGLSFRNQQVAASVEYTLTVPRSLNIEEISLVNGSAEVADMDGDVEISTVNGAIAAVDLRGRTRLSAVNGDLDARLLSGQVELSTVNGSLHVDMSEMSAVDSLTLSSVNGKITLGVPPSVGADVRASSVHGRISNDFGLEVERDRYIGSKLNARLGSGGPNIKLSTVNGSIDITESR